jgi:1,4-dihydroxy-2-naphthoate octaprenyltransferase
MTGGVDTEGYVRALYAPHPVLSGWVTKATLRNAAIGITVVDGLIMLALAARSPQPLLIIGFALAGLFLSSSTSHHHSGSSSTAWANWMSS